MKKRKITTAINLHWIESQSHVITERRKYKSEQKDWYKFFTFENEEPHFIAIITTKLKTFLITRYDELIRNKFSPDFLAYIVNYIAKKEYDFKNNNQGPYAFQGTPVSSLVLKSLFSDYEKHIDLLKKEKIIILNKDYSNQGGKSKRFILPDSPSFEVYFYSETNLIEKIKQNNIQNRGAYFTPHFKQNIEKNEFFVTRIKLKDEWRNKEKLFSKCQETGGDNFGNFFSYYYILELDKAKNLKEAKRALSSKVGEEHRRIYDNLKSIKRQVKSCLIYEEKDEQIPIADLDIPNSHPLFHTMYFAQKIHQHIKSIKSEKGSPSKKSLLDTVKQLPDGKYIFKEQLNIKEYNQIIENEQNMRGFKGVSTLVPNPHALHHYLACEVNLLTLKKELETLIKSVLSGQFYSLFYRTENCKKSDDYFFLTDKETTKKTFMYFLNGRCLKDGSYKFWEVLYNRFPNYTAYVLFSKLTDEVRNGYKFHGKRIFRLESEFRLRFINQIDKSARKKVPLFDMHDGFLTLRKEENILLFQKTFRKVFYNDRLDALSFYLPGGRTIASLPEIRLKDKNL